MSAQGARHEERNSISPSTDEGDTIEFIDTRNDNFQTGGFGLIQKKNFQRDHYLVNATIFSLKNHEFKAGVEYEEDSATVTKRMSGGQQVTIFDNPTNPGPPDLPALLLDDSRRDARSVQRADLAVEREPRAQHLDRSPSGPVERASGADAEPRNPVGPTGNHRRLRRDADHARRGLRASAGGDLDTRRATRRRRSSVPSASTTKRFRWISSSARSLSSGSPT